MPIVPPTFREEFHTLKFIEIYGSCTGSKVYFSKFFWLSVSVLIFQCSQEQCETFSCTIQNSLLLKQNEMFIIWGNSEIPGFTHFLFHLSQHAGTVSGAACCASSYDTSKASSRPQTSYLSLFGRQRFFQLSVPLCLWQLFYTLVCFLCDNK